MTTELYCDIPYMQDALLAASQIPTHTWVPSTMQPLTFDVTSEALRVCRPNVPSTLSKEEALNFIATIHRAKKKLLPDIHARLVPRDKRHSHKDLHPWIPQPNRIMEGMIGYSMKVQCYFLYGETIFLVRLLIRFEQYREQETGHRRHDRHSPYNTLDILMHACCVCLFVWQSLMETQLVSNGHFDLQRCDACVTQSYCRESVFWTISKTINSIKCFYTKTYNQAWTCCTG